MTKAQKQLKALRKIAATALDLLDRRRPATAKALLATALKQRK